MSPRRGNLRLLLTGSPGSLMLMLESSVEGTELCRCLQGKRPVMEQFPTAACVHIAPSLPGKDPDWPSYFCGPLWGVPTTLVTDILNIK